MSKKRFNKWGNKLSDILKADDNITSENIDDNILQSSEEDEPEPPKQVQNDTPDEKPSVSTDDQQNLSEIDLIRKRLADLKQGLFLKPKDSTISKPVRQKKRQPTATELMRANGRKINTGSNVKLTKNKRK